MSCLSRVSLTRLSLIIARYNGPSMTPVHQIFRGSPSIPLSIDPDEFSRDREDAHRAWR